MALPIIHAELAKTDRLPTEHVVDTGYTTGELLVSSEQEYGVEVIGPMRPDTSWQGRQAQQVQAQTETDVEAQTEVEQEHEQEREQRFDITAFSIDWNKQQARCPQGHISRFWREERRSNGKPMTQVEFDSAQCRQCGVKERCTRRNDRGRIVTLRPQAEQEALQQA